MENTALPELKSFLKARRSHLAATLVGPAPDRTQISELLELACRVPDHGKISPWRFIVYENSQADGIGEKLVQLSEKRQGPLGDNAKMMELERFKKAPLVIGVLSCPNREHKVPVWEQELAVGAVCLSLLNACFATGFAAQWLTDWYAFDDEAATYLGARAGERFAGFIHIGSPSVTPKERSRPDVAQLTEYFENTSSGVGA
ncbi:putative NAD(P)H nitroreductase YdjA [Pseudovibrio axinellae]|uniref:Putative NAD(P)H nitroreductase n=1 Tax=Pseudovibrio axinellae TaxID=989403 RepID=A0A166AKK0_9HYPH|nr:nitroreductase [Pseudovibrio axinellae]KZL21237.1 putative NAD(P)H nitroreductase YdjA [Pseudovibrio axinellae]SEQ93035.1 Nitroreductase [Pseudovibrio axinellae]